MARYVRWITSGLPPAPVPPLVVAPYSITVGVPQLSVAETAPGFGAGMALRQPSCSAAGAVMTGTVVSVTVMTWLEEATCPHVSVADQVRTIVCGQAPVAICEKNTAGAEFVPHAA